MKKSPLSRRDFIGTTAKSALALPFINFGVYKPFRFFQDAYSKRTMDLMSESLVMDMLAPLHMTKLFTAQAKGENPLGFSKEELKTLIDSGITVFHPAIGMGGPNAYEIVMQFFAAHNSLVAEHPDLVMRVDSAKDLSEIKASGKVGIILGLQNSDHFRNPGDVKQFHFIGQRISQLTYNTQNRIASGSTDRADGGISDFGEQIVRAMNEVGMAVDVSHCGDQTTLDAFELSSQPVLITHSNCRALTPGHPRCKTDEAIKKMAEKGGVMGITAVRNFVTTSEPTTIEHYVNHIDHVAKLVGIEHVGVGTDSDLDGYDDLPKEIYDALKSGYKDTYSFREKIDIEGLDHPKKMFDLTEALIRRKYSNENIKAILGENFRRVLSEIWG